MKLRLLPVVDVSQIEMRIFALIEISPNTASKMTIDSKFYQDFHSINAVTKEEEGHLHKWYWTGGPGHRTESWKKNGPFLMLLHFDDRDLVIASGPLIMKCIVRTGKSTWRKYDLFRLECAAREKCSGQ